MTLFVGGPLDGQERPVPDQVNSVVYPHLDIRPDHVWDWDHMAFVYIGPVGEITNDPPASIRNLTYRRVGDVFQLEDEWSTIVGDMRTGQVHIEPASPPVTPEQFIAGPDRPAES